jgi:hypothetical protein
VRLGDRYGRLVVAGFFYDQKNNRRATVHCDCGTVKAVLTGHLTSGKISSCGCLHREVIKVCNRTHGRSLTREHLIWKGMIQRCCNPKNPGYPRYGGRGIGVCERWRNSFQDFFADVGEAPSAKHSLDRFPDNDGDYELGNVRWATQEQQTRNTRRNHWLTLRGETLTITDWSRRLGLTNGALIRRIKAGWPVERVLTGSTREW